MRVFNNKRAYSPLYAPRSCIDAVITRQPAVIATKAVTRGTTFVVLGINL